MTYNIRYSILDDPRDHWDDRKDKMLQLLNYYEPTIFGVQEAMKHQLEFIKENKKGYNFIGAGREDGISEGEYNAIFYDASRLEVIEQNTFWLSPTDTKVSKGWDARYTRICTYALFEDKETKKRFWVFNTHFDSIGSFARENSAVLVLNKIKGLNTNNLPLVLMGDLNALPDSNPIQTLDKSLDNSYGISKNQPYGPKGTFNGFKPTKAVEKRIDYIYVSKFEVFDYIHIDDRLDDNQFISDHLPVLIKTAIKD